MLAVARGSHSCAAEIDLGTTTPRKKPGPENLGSGDETRELHKTRVFHQIFNAADGPEKSGFRACLTEIRPKPPSINPQTQKKSHNQNPGFARKTQVTHSPIPGLSRVDGSIYRRVYDIDPDPGLTTGGRASGGNAIDFERIENIVCEPIPSGSGTWRSEFRNSVPTYTFR